MSLTVVVKVSPRRILQWTQYILLAFSIVTLGYCAFVLMDTFAFQRGERQKLEGVLRRSTYATPPTRIFSAHVPVLPPESTEALLNGLLGRLDIPRLSLSVMVVEGTTKTDLRHAAGHISGTALPGEVGNIGISGHRDTLFRPLRDIRHNDTIVVTTVLGEFRYRVVASTIVVPSDVSVLAQSQEEILTLVTCYPFHFVGPAPGRFIVRAVRFDKSKGTGNRFNQ